MSQTIAKVVKPKQIQPGMRVRLTLSTSDSPYANFREVAEVRPLGIYHQTDIGFTDGSGDTWGRDAEFEVESAELVRGDAAR